MYSVLNKLPEYIYTFTYQKTLIHTLLLVFKIGLFLGRFPIFRVPRTSGVKYIAI